MSEQKGAYKVALTAATDTTAGGVLSLANPEGADVIITRIILDITTASDAAANINMGIAADGTTSSTTITAGTAVGSVATTDILVEEGAGGHKWTSGQYLTSTASATTAGMVANVYIEYIRV